MPQKVLKFTGINRRVNEFQSTGACEELVNIRPTAAGAEIVKDKRVVCDASGYNSVVEHKFGSQVNILAVTSSNVLWIDLSGVTKQELSTPDIPKEVSSAGNVILVTCENGKQISYKFNNGTYEEFSTTLPDIDMWVELVDFGGVVTFTNDSKFHNVGEANEGLAKAYSLFYSQYAHGLAGPIVVGCTFELEDGSEVWSTGFSIIDPTKDARYVASTGSGVVSITARGAKTATLKFRVYNHQTVTGVKNIKFYSSLPLTPFEMQEASGVYATKKINNRDLNIAGQQMYLQKVLSLRGSDSFTLKTGYAIASDELMPVTSGMIYRSGDAVSYNNRFHFFNSSVEHTAQYMSSGVHSNIQHPAESNYVDVRKARLYVAIDNGEDKTFIYDAIPDVVVGSTMDLVYPMGGIKEGYMQTSDDDFNTSRWYSIEFSDSTAYNYSCAIDWVMSTPCEPPVMNKVIEAHGQTVMLKRESNAINVSAPFNPFVFPVEYSYGFGGKIIDIVTAYQPISSTQIGQYPLTVFTSNGIYALEQGSGAVLYGSIVPLQPLIIDGRAIATPYGTFFSSSRNIYALSGREAVNVSHALNGKLGNDIRINEVYKALCCNKDGALHDFGNVLSMLEFQNFAMSAVFTYDPLNNELLISKNDTSYSYVFNLDTKAYHKVPNRYTSSSSNARYVIERRTDGTKKVVDLYTEISSFSQNVLLQSRPIALETFYTHISRILLMVDATLQQSENNLCFSVFGGDNLNDWKCIASAQKANAVFSHIRTNRAPKSYKYYTILINGTVPTDTDISDIIADYTIVNRRLG